MMDALIKELENAEVGSYELNKKITKALGGQSSYYPYNYTLDLASAIKLLPEGWDWTIDGGSRGRGYAHLSYTTDLVDLPHSIHVEANTPELAFCIAALKARVELQK